MTSGISFLNANSDRRLDTPKIKAAFPELHPSARQEGLTKVLDDELKKNNIVFLFELAPEMVSFFKNYANCNKIVNCTIKYNQSKLAFSFMIFTKDALALKSVVGFPLTKTGSYVCDETRPQAPKLGENPSSDFILYKDNIFGDNFEKAVVMAEIEHNGTTVHVYCTHLGLTNDARLNQMIKLVEIIKKNSTDVPFVVGGDFNCFDSTKKTTEVFMEQIEILTSICCWKTSHFVSTFNSYPYDIVFKMTLEEVTEYKRLEALPVDDSNVVLFRDFCNAMCEKYGLNGGVLDHIFSNGINVDVEMVDVGTLSDHSMVRVVF